MDDKDKGCFEEGLTESRNVSKQQFKGFKCAREKVEDIGTQRILEDARDS